MDKVLKVGFAAFDSLEEAVKSASRMIEAEKKGRAKIFCAEIKVA